MDLLKNLKKDDKALREVISIGKKVNNSKHCSKGKVDWKVVDLVMTRKLEEAEKGRKT